MFCFPEPCPFPQGILFCEYDAVLGLIANELTLLKDQSAG